MFALLLEASLIGPQTPHILAPKGPGQAKTKNGCGASTVLCRGGRSHLCCTRGLNCRLQHNSMCVSGCEGVFPACRLTFPASSFVLTRYDPAGCGCRDEACRMEQPHIASRHVATLACVCGRQTTHQTHCLVACTGRHRTASSAAPCAIAAAVLARRCCPGSAAVAVL